MARAVSICRAHFTRLSCSRPTVSPIDYYLETHMLVYKYIYIHRLWFNYALYTSGVFYTLWSCETIVMLLISLTRTKTKRWLVQLSHFHTYCDLNPWRRLLGLIFCICSLCYFSPSPATAPLHSSLLLLHHHNAMIIIYRSCFYCICQIKTSFEVRIATCISLRAFL